MKNIATFGERLTSLMESHDLSAAALTELTKLPNTMAMVRLMRDETSESRRQSFYESLRACGSPFTSDELTELEAALTVSRLGKRSYKAYRGLFDLLFMPAQKSDNAGCFCELTARLRALAPDVPLQLMCTNCCDTGLLPALAPLFEDRSRLIEMHHFTSVNADTRNPMLLLGSAWRLIHDSRYRPYIVTQRDNGTDAYYCAPNTLFFKFGLGAAAREAMCFVSVSEGLRRVYFQEGSFLFDTVFRSLHGLDPSPKPLRGHWGIRNQRELLAFLTRMYQKAFNRAIYVLRPEPGFEFIEPEILIRQLQESPSHLTADARSNMDGLREMMELRYRLYMGGAQPVCLTLSKEETKRFLLTGRADDQPSTLRPLTLEERRRWMRRFFDRLTEDTSFQIRFLQDGLKQRRYRLVCFEGQGLMPLKLGDANERPGYTHALIAEPLLVEQFTRFYKNELLTYHVYSREDSVAWLKQTAAEILY